MVIAARGNKQPHADIGTAEQERRQVAGPHGTPVEIAEQGNREWQRQGEQQGEREQRPAGEKFTHGKLPERHRLSKYVFQGPAAALLAPHFHGERGGKENEQQRHPGKERSYIGDIAREKCFHPEKYKK